ncbi:comta [Scenedesmus sp. PABB004]|nr:comta [Scenedesmus sp. PABB004]
MQLQLPLCLSSSCSITCRAQLRQAVRPRRATGRRRAAAATAARAAEQPPAQAQQPPAQPQQAQERVPRRAALLAGLLAAAGARRACGAQPGAAAASQLQAPPADAAAGGGGAAFYAAWPYAVPGDILPFITSRAAPGDVQGVLDAMDAFSAYYPQFRIGPEKGALLEAVLAEASPRPRAALELGTFLGYSAMRTARALGPGGWLICVEANPANAAVARELLRYVGLGGRVTVVDGLAADAIPRLPALLAAQAGLQAGEVAQPGGQQAAAAAAAQGFDFVFLDHAKDCYLPDLVALEAAGLVRRGTTVVADNVVYPGAPGYLEHLEVGGRYATRLLPAAYEYDQPWREDWEPKRDALSVSVALHFSERSAPAAPAQARRRRRQRRRRCRAARSPPPRGRMSRPGRRGGSTLVSLLHALAGGRVVLELRGDVRVSGTLSSVDDYMNCMLDGALWQPPAGPATPFPSLYVKGRSLRMVHLPAGADAGALLDAHAAAQRRARVAGALELVNRRHERLAKGDGGEARGGGEPGPPAAT